MEIFYCVFTKKISNPPPPPTEGFFILTPHPFGISITQGFVKTPPLPSGISVFPLPSFQSPSETPSRFTCGKFTADRGTINSLYFFAMLFILRFILFLIRKKNLNNL